MTYREKKKKATFSLSNQTGISEVFALSVMNSWKSEHLEPSRTPEKLKLGPGHPRKVCEENSSWTKIAAVETKELARLSALRNWVCPVFVSVACSYFLPLTLLVNYHGFHHAVSIAGFCPVDTVTYSLQLQQQEQSACPVLHVAICKIPPGISTPPKSHLM